MNRVDPSPGLIVEQVLSGLGVEGADLKEAKEELSRRGALADPTESRPAEEPKESPPVTSAGFSRARAREVALRPVLDRWVRELRSAVFGGEGPPFPDMQTADEEWVSLARGVLLGPAMPDEEPPGEKGERQPPAEAEVLELPRPDGWNPDSTEERLAKRVPVGDAGSQHFLVARAVRRMAEYSGHRPGALTRYVLTGEEPTLEAARFRVESRWAPSGDPEELYQTPLRPQRHAVLRLNEPPTVDKMREILGALRDEWEDSWESERRALVELVEEIVPENKRDGASRAAWEPVAEEWNREREEGEGPGWRSLQKRYADEMEQREADGNTHEEE